MIRPPGACSVWHHVVILVEGRDALQRHLAERGIGTAVHYPIVPPRQPAYAEDFRDRRFPVAEDHAARALSLPVGSYLRDEEVDAVAEPNRPYARSARAWNACRRPRMAVIAETRPPPSRANR